MDTVTETTTTPAVYRVRASYGEGKVHVASPGRRGAMYHVLKCSSRAVEGCYRTEEPVTCGACLRRFAGDADLLGVQVTSADLKASAAARTKAAQVGAGSAAHGAAFMRREEPSMEELLDGHRRGDHGQQGAGDECPMCEAGHRSWRVRLPNGTPDGLTILVAHTGPGETIILRPAAHALESQAPSVYVYPPETDALVLATRRPRGTQVNWCSSGGSQDAAEAISYAVMLNYAASLAQELDRAR